MVRGPCLGLCKAGNSPEPPSVPLENLVAFFLGKGSWLPSQLWPLKILKDVELNLEAINAASVSAQRS